MQHASSASRSPTLLFCRLAALGIPLATLDTVPLLDVAIDGSDEARLPNPFVDKAAAPGLTASCLAQVDPDLNLVKGRGGALLREKVRRCLTSLCALVLFTSLP